MSVHDTCPLDWHSRAVDLEKLNQKHIRRPELGKTKLEFGSGAASRVNSHLDYKRGLFVKNSNDTIGRVFAELCRVDLTSSFPGDLKGRRSMHAKWEGAGWRESGPN